MKLAVMMNTPKSDGCGFSPDLSMELAIEGERFSVASIGPNGMIVRAARHVRPGRGTVRLDVGGHVTVYDVWLVDGVDPGRDLQRFQLIGSREEAAG
jgi:hypothetical protein